VQALVDTGTSRRKPLRILLTEGASTSAREALTALALNGHLVDVCDPNAHCICRFSSFLNRFHQSPAISTDSRGYLELVTRLLAREKFDVLLPIHEQGLIFAKAKRNLSAVGVALPTFEAYRRALDKASFAKLLAELGIAHPKTLVVESFDRIPPARALPFVLKLPIAAAARGVFIIRTADGFSRAKRAIGDGKTRILVQDFLEGDLERAQAVFDRGRLVGLNTCRQLVEGVGGGAAVKESVFRESVRADLKRIAARLDWHGALSVDYIMHAGVPHYIDCNPRLVEPMAAAFAGLDLVDLLLRVSLGERPPEAPAPKEGMRTHLALQALLGVASRTRSRRAVLREAWRIARGTGVYAESREEFLPIRRDRLSAIPLASALIAVLASPKMSEILPRRGWGAGLLTAEAVAEIAAFDDQAPRPHALPSSAMRRVA
jgi:glutathione synthase/RimK-type ligase-like ATP-grasp enzyme